MNIAEAERRTGLTRANIRFYEKEGLLKPTRGENGYRDYTEDNVQTLRKIMLLRRLRLLRVIRSGLSLNREGGAALCGAALFLLRRIYESHFYRYRQHAPRLRRLRA